MYLNSILSYLGAWEKLQTKYGDILSDIKQSLFDINEEKLEKLNRHKHSEPKDTISSRSLIKVWEESLINLGWNRQIRIHYGRIRAVANKELRSYQEIDFVKEKIGLELSLGKRAFVESHLFVDFPYFVRANIFQLAVILVPMNSLTQQLAGGANGFESIYDRLIEASPLMLSYPFAIMGFSNEENGSIEVTELTSKLDQFLINTVGLSLDEMVVVNEGQNYEFKETLPRNEKFAREICAFANLTLGGIILLGIDKNGDIKGIPKDPNLDQIQLQITNIIHSLCSPVPEFEFHIFDTPNNPARSILVVQVFELDNKPCMTQEKVYIRSGSSARPAKSDEIRRLILK